MKKNFKRIFAIALAVLMVCGCIPMGVFAEEAVALPSATISAIDEAGYTYAFDVKVPEPTFDQNVAYAGWLADFELTFNKDIKLNADRSANGFVGVRNGVIGMGAMTHAPTTDVILEAGQSLKVLEYINTLTGGTSDAPNFLAVFTYWKDFQFGIFLDQNFLAANPDFNATLELKLYNPENGEATVIASQMVGKPELPTATITKVENKNLTFAMKFAADAATAQQLAFYGNWYADFEISFNKKVTFNANGGKDGYLSGEYGEWGWINAPIEDVTLNAGEVLKVMEYAAEMKGEPGLKYTYKEVVEVVKEFNCGVFFEPAFLTANPDIEANIVLKMYNPANEEECYVIGDAFTYGIPELPTATVDELEKGDLTFAMNFKADAVTEDQLNYYGKWFADFELTINKTVTFDANGGADGYLAGQYDGSWNDEDWSWNGEWLKVPFEPVTLEANKPLKIMAYAAEMLGEPGLKYTYKEVVDVVKDFDCGVFFTPEFLAANPDLEVTLELKMYNPADESVNYVIGETYVFNNSFVAQNTATGKYYTKVTDALNEAQAGQTVRLVKNVEEMMVAVYDNITLDINGYELTTSYLFCTGDVVDNSASNNGKIKTNNFMIREDNTQLPVKDAEGAIKLYEVVKVQHAIAQKTETSVTYAFQPKFEVAAHEALLAGQNVTGVKILVKATWTRPDGTIGTQDFVYADAKVSAYINSYFAGSNKYGQMFTLTINNYQNYQDLEYQAYVVSEYNPSFTVDRVTSKEVTLSGISGSSAVVSSGTKIEGNTADLLLNISNIVKSSSNIVLKENEEQKSIDVHVNGVAKDNTVPVIVTVKAFAEAGLNDGNLKLYHVEAGVTNAMTQVASIADVDKHNEFFYDVATGDVTMALATFSEITRTVNKDNPWDGTVDTSWYNKKQRNNAPYEIFNANQLAGLGALVDGGETFEGITVRMCMDVNLKGTDEKGNRIFFNPIGYDYDHLGGKVFMGTFDGNGNTISGLFQEGWDMENKFSGEDYTYSTAGGGLFASVKNATIKNLTIDDAYIVMECVDMGAVVGYAQGNCTFENLIVKNTIIANYNRATGGAIGEVSNGHHILKNVDVEESVVISALWGTFDPSIGGIIGAKWEISGSSLKGEGFPVSVYMNSCDVAAELDVYNDVTSAYRWYSYRRCGMLIGYTEESKTVNGRTEATADFLTTKNCTVKYGEWVNYHYCGFRYEYYPFVRVEAGNEGFNGAYSNARYGLPKINANGDELVVKNHEANKEADHTTPNGNVALEDHNVEIVFNQLYGGGQGCYGGNYHVDEAKGVTNITEDAPAVTEKFSATNNNVVIAGTKISLGDLFTEIEGTGVVDSGVYAFASPLTEADTARATFDIVGANANWQDKKLTFTGTGFVEVTINDYYYCKPTTIKVLVINHDINYYIAAKRSTSNYLYMTNDLGTANTKRYQAIDSGKTTLESAIQGASDNSMFKFENVSGNTFKIKIDKQYLGWTSGNSGTLVTENAITATVTPNFENRTVRIYFADSEGDRYLGLNTGSNFFAWYLLTSTQNYTLSLIPAYLCEHTSTENIDAVAPTCSEVGYKAGIKCNDCKKVINGCEEIPATGEHDYVDGVCSVCGKLKPADAGWVLVTDISQLSVGKRIVIVAKNANYAMSTTQNGNNRGQASVVKNGDTITFGDDVQILVLEAGNVDGTFAFYTGAGYLYAASSGSNYLRTQTTNDANGSWLITVDAEGIATVKAQGTNTRNLLRYNATNNPPIFSAYGSGQTDICLYVYVDGENGGDDSGETPTCQHTNTTKTTTTPATCVKDGLATITCNDCKETVGTEVILATSNHNYVGGACDVCGEPNPDAEPEQPSEPKESTVTMVAENLGLANGKDFTSTTISDVTISASKGTNTNNGPKYYDIGKAVRLYKNNKLTVSVDGTITKIVVNCVSGYATPLKTAIEAAKLTGVEVSVEGTIVTITFKEGVSEFTTIATTGDQVRIVSMAVTYIA